MFNQPEDITEMPYDRFGDHQDLIHNIAFDYHGRRLATCSSDKTVAIYDRKADGSWSKSAFWRVHGGPVWRVVWAHPEFGQVIATCSYDRNMAIWEEMPVKEGTFKQGKTVSKKKHWVRRSLITDSRANITDLDFAPRRMGLILASCTTQGQIRMYEAPDTMNVGNWNLLHELQAFHTRCGCIAWSQSRMHRPLIAVGSDELRSEGTERIVVYENLDGLRKWQRIVSVKLDLPAPVTDLKFSPIILAGAHQLAIAAGDVHLYCINVSRSAILEDETGSMVGDAPVTATDYSAKKVALLGDVQKAWRIRYNITGNVITATSLDGTLRTWKSLFVNQWVKLSEMTIDDYKSVIDCSPIKSRSGFLSERIIDNSAKSCY